MKKLFNSFLIIAALMLSLKTHAQMPGSNDPSFNPTDKGFGFGDGANSYVSSSAIQSDGKIIIGGNFTKYNGTIINCIARLNSDGSLDPTFKVGTTLNTYAGYAPYVYTCAIQKDGKIIIGGAFGITYKGTTLINIARLNSDGSIDGTFNPGYGTNASISNVIIQNDGKIIIGGYFGVYNTKARKHIARLNIDGSLDLTFNVGFGTDGYSINAIVLQSDGKIIIGGDFTSYNGTAMNRIARLNTDGTLDATFKITIGGWSDIYTCALQSDGKIIIAGMGLISHGIVRLNINGSIDTTFKIGTGVGNLNIRTCAIQKSGKIIIGGGFTSYNGTTINNIASINSDGSLDQTFIVGTGVDGGVSFPTINTYTIQSDGKIIVGGSFVTYNGTTTNRIARLNTDGSLDRTFHAGTAANSTVEMTTTQSDGKIIIGGNFTGYNGTTINGIARLNSDGTLDGSFKVGTGVSTYLNNAPFVSASAIQNDGKIIIGGGFTKYNGNVKGNIARLNSDGTIDSTFKVSSGASGYVHSCVIQSDGKIIIGGDFYSYNGTISNRIARLNLDGSIDSTFKVGSGVGIIGSSVKTIIIQSDGKIVIGGDFNLYNGVIINRVARLNVDGSLDSTFKVGSGANNIITTCAQQNDGKIIIGGNFTTYNGTTSNRISRLNADGSIDSSFKAVVSGANDTVRTSVIQSDGKIIIGGNFKLYNGTSINHIVRLNTDGSLDSTFKVITGADSTIRTCAIQSDGKIIIGGNFTSYNNIGRNRIARIYGCSVTSPCVSGQPYAVKEIENQNYLLVYPNPNNGLFTIQTEHEGTYSILNELGQTIQKVKLNDVNNYSINIENLNNGIYFIVGLNDGEIIRQKVVVAK